MNFIAKYRRVCYDSDKENKSTNSTFLDVTSKEIDTKYSINLYNYEVSQGITQDSVVPLPKNLIVD